MCIGGGSRAVSGVRKRRLARHLDGIDCRVGEARTW